MNRKKIGTIVMSVVLAASIGTTAWATSQIDSDGSQATVAGQFQRLKRWMNGEKSELTDEQKAEIEERQAEMQETRQAREDAWANLTDEQKEDIYSLQEQIAKLHNELADQYSEYGLIDSETAAKIKEETTDRVQKIRESGSLPMLQAIGGGRGPGFLRQDKASAEDTGTSDSTATDASGT